MESQDYLLPFVFFGLKLTSDNFVKQVKQSSLGLIISE